LMGTLSLTMAPHWDMNLSLIFFGAHGWPSSDTSLIWYITSLTITCVQPLLDFFVVNPEAYNLHIHYLCKN
jgi:hypothetical protein